ncbi:MAG: HD domain-containing protein [Firmicutes bacterium]|nr:HD domain-containing protein [Bacillota bacterium]
MENIKIIRAYLMANKLKEVIRTGWQELEVSSPRLESVAEHVYGTLVLTIMIASERKLDLDFTKVFMMITIKELEKVDKELTPRSYPTVEDRNEKAKRTIATIFDGFIQKDEIVKLLEECQNLETEEAKFVKMVSTLESDLQAKIYDINGFIDKDKAKEDAEACFGVDNMPDINNPSDGFTTYNKKYYVGNEYFMNFSNDIQKINSREDIYLNNDSRNRS